MFSRRHGYSVPCSWLRNQALTARH
jgi:hypothetical protein